MSVQRSCQDESTIYERWIQLVGLGMQVAGMMIYARDDLCSRALV